MPKKQKYNGKIAMDANVVTAEPVTLVDIMAKAVASISVDIDETKAADIIRKNKEEVEEANAVYSGYDPESLMAIAETSDAVRPNIDSYVQNIEGNGHRYELMGNLDLESENINEQLKTMIYMDRWITARDAAMAQDTDMEESEVEEPTDQEVEEQKERLKRQAMREKFEANAWFENCGIDCSFLDLRERKRRDEESVGHAAWECIRDSRGKLIRLAQVAGYTVYPVEDNGEGVKTQQTERLSPITTRTVTVTKSFPRYVQILNGDKVYYKSLGDARTISRFTGKAYKDFDALYRAENEKYLKEDQYGKKPKPECLVAHEMLWFNVWSPRTPAGVPRWIGALLQVLGSRAAAQVNYEYFDNKCIPAAMLSVSGRMNHQAKEHLQSIWNSKVKGRKNFHKLIIFDNDTLGLKNNPATDKNQNAAINFVPLTDNQRGDSLFDNYSKTNRDVIGANFRQPPALRGETPKDLNRATYLGSLQYGEYQIYSQLRRAFDWIINKHIMPEILGPGHIIEFVSNSPKITDPVERSKLIDVFGKHGGVVPNDIRQLAAEDFNTQYEPIDQPWGNQPLALTLATGGAEMSDMSNDEVQGKLEELENRIGRKLTHHMRTQGYGEDAKVTVKLPQEYDDDDMVDLEAFLDEDFNE